MKRLLKAIAVAVDYALANVIATAFAQRKPETYTYIEPESETGTYDPYAATLADEVPTEPIPPIHRPGTRCCG